MKPDYQKTPFTMLPLGLHGWFEQIVQQAEIDQEFRFWHAVLPPGSSTDDALIVSHCLRVLFPERVDRENCTPVAVELVL